MNYTDIETFLEAVRVRSFSKAAKNMYISQSTVSHRLKNLENELEGQLFIRSKGHNTIELTEKGRLFVPIAERWAQLFEETEALKERNCASLRIACNESTYLELVSPLLESYGDENPDVRVSINICDSSQVYELVKNRLADLGLSSIDASREEVEVRLIARQPVCVIRYGDQGGEELVISPRELDPAKEIRFTGGHFQTLEAWRRKWFGEAQVLGGRVEFNSVQAGIHYMRRCGGWALYSLSGAEKMKEEIPLQICKLSEAPDPRPIYLLQRRGNGWKQEVAERFVERLSASL